MGIGSCRLDRSFADREDVAQSHDDNKLADHHLMQEEDGVPQEPNNGHLLQERKALNAMSHSGRSEDMQKEKESHRSNAAVEEQKEEVIEVVEEDQNQKEFVDMSGVKARNTEGEKPKARPFKESLAYSNGQSNYMASQTPLSLGHSDIHKEGGSWASGHMAQFLLL